jgi:hypothetical protein
MKIYFYVRVNKSGQTDYELREFDVSEVVFAEIQKIAEMYGNRADSDLHDVNSHLILGDSHFEFDAENEEYFEKIKSRLLKGKEKESDERILAVDYDESINEEDADIIFGRDGVSELNQSSLLDRSSKNRLLLEAEAARFLDQWKVNIEPIAAIQNQYKEIETLKTLPQVLLQCVSDIDDFLHMLAQFEPELDFSGYSHEDEQRESELKKKLDSLGGLSKKLHDFHVCLNAAKRLHYSILKSNSVFTERLGKVDEQALDKHYVSLSSALEKLSDLLSRHRHQVQLELAKVEGKKHQNTIIIRTWYASKSDEEQREMFGIPSDGHTTVELYKNENERIYLGFYVCPNKDKSTIGKAFKKVKLPSPDPGRGYFVDLEYDQSLVGAGKKFSRCETVVIKCDRPGAELDFDAAYDWAQRTMAKYPVKTAYGRSIRILDDYNFYHNNCASFGAEALRQAGAGDHIRYSGKTVIDIDTPSGVREYALRLEEKLRRTAAIAQRETEISSNPFMSTQDKCASYLGLAVERLKLIKDNPVLDEFIQVLNRERMNLMNLETGDVDTFLDQLFGRLYVTVSDFYGVSRDHMTDPVPGADEIVAVIKHLTMLMPVQERILIKAMNSTISVSLYQFNLLHVQGDFGEFADEYLAANRIVDAVVRDDPASLVSKALHIRAALFKLDKQYQVARAKYEEHAAKYKSQPDQVQNCFKNIREYYHAAFRQLEETLTELRNQIYFRPGAIGQNNELLTSLQNVFLPGVRMQEQFNLPVILQHAKGENYWAETNKSLDDIDKDSQKQIFFKTVYPDGGLPAPEKPNVFAFLNWGKRHQYFEVENKAKLYTIVNHQDYDWQTKLRLISELVEDNKPGVLKFWRRSERHRYDDMGARASVVCLVEAFSQGKLSEARLIVELEKVIPKLAEPGHTQMNNFRKSLAAQYQAGVKSQLSSSVSQANSPAVTHARVLRKLLKSVATSNQIYGDTFEDLGVRLYSAHQYQQLKDQKNKQQAGPKKTRVVAPEEQVEIETGLWRRIS